MPRPLERRDIEVSAVFDIETEDWDKYVVGGIYLADGSYEDFTWHREDRLVDAILSVPGTVWAHAGGVLDFKWLLDHIARRGYNAQIVAAGSRIVSATIGKTRLCDSFALCPIKLQDFTSGQGVAKEELNLPCECGDACGGYCAIRRSMSSSNLARLREYLRADCESLVEGLERLREFADENDLDLGATIGSSAWRNVRRLYGLPDSDMGTTEHNFCRAAYYGGRVQLYRPGLTPRAHEYDVNSMYPWSLRTFALPVGDRTSDYGRAAQANLVAGKEGIYRCTVTVPEMHLPPLPYRYKNGIKTSYPFGTFGGTYALPELQHALSRGARVSASESIIFSGERILFRDWIDRLFHLRANAPHGGKKGPLGTFLKLYMNSLTGKFGSNPERDKFVINPSSIKVCNGDSVSCPTGGASECGLCCREHCAGTCGAHYQLSENVFYSKSFRIDGCAHVEWAAYLTSHARVALNQQQIAVDEGHDVVYSDTDSIYSISKRTSNIGKDLGQWDYGGECNNFVGLAPKCYYYERNGKAVKKAKGIRLHKSALTIEPGKKYQDNSGIIGFRVGAKSGRFFERKDTARTLSKQTGDRIELGNGETRAPRAEELE